VRRRRIHDRPEMPIAPMIDCVFLMLVYFMTTSSLDRSEADRSCPHGRGGVVDSLPAIDEQAVSVSAKGTLFWNGMTFQLQDGAPDWHRLWRQLDAFQKASARAGSTPSIRLKVHEDSPTQVVIRILDALEKARIAAIHFG
jgi:biopolymer transport protein ExbD